MQERSSRLASGESSPAMLGAPMTDVRQQEGSFEHHIDLKPLGLFVQFGGDDSAGTVPLKNMDPGLPLLRTFLGTRGSRCSRLALSHTNPCGYILPACQS